MEDWNFTADGTEKGVDAQLSCELDPLVPVGIVGGGTSCRNAALYVFVRKAEITAEIRFEVGVTSL